MGKPKQYFFGTLFKKTKCISWIILPLVILMVVIIFGNAVKKGLTFEHHTLLFRCTVLGIVGALHGTVVVSTVTLSYNNYYMISIRG